MNTAVPSAVPSSSAKRPGGRSAQVQAQVRAALEELVAEQGRERVTVPAVAERAGVSASSIYRRLPPRPRPPAAGHRHAARRPRGVGERTDRAPGQAVQHLAAEGRGRAGQRRRGHRLPAQPPPRGAGPGRAGPRARRGHADGRTGDRSPDRADRVPAGVRGGAGARGAGGAAGGGVVCDQPVSAVPRRSCLKTYRKSTRFRDMSITSTCLTPRVRRKARR
jgi:hypothetical protein